MHVHWIDQYRSGNSLIHQLDARIKLVLTIVYIVVASLTPMGAWLAYGMLFALAIAATSVSGLGFSLVQRRALVAIPFALAAAACSRARLSCDCPIGASKRLANSRLGQGHWALRPTLA